MAIEKREYTPRPLRLEVNGHAYEMRRMTATEWIELRRRDKAEWSSAMTEAALEAVIDSSLPEGTELSVDEAVDLMDAWIAAHREEAVPPA